uniref:Uncharacterized protein n=1 Tax=Panagrolaimus superbus TaxID=310955 RepID=A0A914Z6Z6_9BILA
MSDQQEYMEAPRQRVDEFKKNNENKRQAFEEEQKAYIERNLRIVQLRDELSNQKETLKETKANIDAAQKSYQGDFEKVKKATQELNDVALEAVNRRRNVVKLISVMCDNKVDRTKKLLEDIDASSYTKALAESDELNYERKSVSAKITEVKKKISAYSYGLGLQGFSD